MSAICYVCNKESADFLHRNITELKSQHTRTPIGEFIKTLTAGFDLVRNIDGESNSICADCLQQIEEYDWMKQQAIEQEAKLRFLLLSTELELMIVNSEPDEIESDIEDRHSELIYSEELENTDTESQPSDEAEETYVDVQLPPTSRSLLKNPIKPAVPAPSNCKRTIVRILKPPAKRSRILNQENETSNSDVDSVNGNDVLVSTTTAPSSVAASEKPIKPMISYPLLVAMALKNSRNGSLLVFEIYSFVCEHFPYFRSATEDWKRSIRYNLTSSPCFEKIKPDGLAVVAPCRWHWRIKPSKVADIDEKLRMQSHRNPALVESAMARPENLPALYRGEMKHGSSKESYERLKDFEDDEIEHECVNGLADTFIYGKENFQIDDESFKSPYDLLDQIDIDDLKLFQYMTYDDDIRIDF